MSVRPVRLNAAIAWLFIVGSACFVLGSVPAYLDAVGGTVDGVTYFVGSIFFTSASFCQLVQAQSPATTGVDEAGQHRAGARAARGAGCRTTAAGSPRRPSSPARCSSTSARWRRSPTTRPPRSRTATSGGPTCSGRSCSSWRARSASSPSRGRFLASSRARCRGGSRWVNMLGSVLFMASALASYVLPSTDELLEHPAVRRRHAVRRRVLPRRRRPDVPGLAPGTRPAPASPPVPRHPIRPKEKRMTSHIPSDADAALFGNRFATREVPSRDVPGHRHDARSTRCASSARTSPSRATRPATSPPSSPPGWSRRRSGSSPRTCTATSSTTPSTRARPRSSSAASGCSPTCSTRPARRPARAPRARPRRSCSGRCR